MQISEAHKYCSQIAKGHYENFPVASLLIPGKFRKAIYAIYAFARKADDFADENEDKDLSRNQLNEWRDYLQQTEKGSPPDLPEFIALADILDKFSLNTVYLHDLIDAFFQDTQINRYKDWTGLLAYCNKSANPVGRLLLQLFDLHHNELLEKSDALCTGLQLINFWQDLSVDIPRDRFYIPEVELNSNILLNERDIALYSHKQPLIDSLTAKTREIYQRGKDLYRYLPGRIGMEIKLTYNGGDKILAKVEKTGSGIFNFRPQLNTADLFTIIAKTILKK